MRGCVAIILFFYSRFKEKNELKILDIGSGTGASIIGILEYFAQNNFYGDKMITVYSVDGNENALQYQKKFLQSFCLKHPKFNVKLYPPTCKKFSFKEEEFRAELYYIMKKFDQTYDIILTSKFLSELYVNNENARNLYYNFASIVSGYLSHNSLLIISDVTIKTHTEHIPIIMKREFHQFISEEENSIQKGSSRINYILPLSCAFWHKECISHRNCFTQKKYDISHSQEENCNISKITFDIFFQKLIAKKILHHTDKEDKYFCNSAKPNQACCKGKLEDFNNLSDSEKPDGFLL